MGIVASFEFRTTVDGVPDEMGLACGPVLMRYPFDSAAQPRRFSLGSYPSQPPRTSTDWMPDR